MDFKKRVWRKGTRLISPCTGTLHGLQRALLGFQKMRGISWPADWIPTSDQLLFFRVVTVGGPNLKPSVLGVWFKACKITLTGGFIWAGLLRLSCKARQQCRVVILTSLDPSRQPCIIFSFLNLGYRYQIKRFGFIMEKIKSRTIFHLSDRFIFVKWSKIFHSVLTTNDLLMQIILFTLDISGDNCFTEHF